MLSHGSNVNEIHCNIVVHTLLQQFSSLQNPFHTAVHSRATQNDSQNYVTEYTPSPSEERPVSYLITEANQHVVVLKGNPPKKNIVLFLFINFPSGFIAPLDFFGVAFGGNLHVRDEIIVRNRRTIPQCKG